MSQDLLDHPYPFTEVFPPPRNPEQKKLAFIFMSVLLTYRNRVITESDLGFIVTMIDQHRNKGRSAISRRLCEAWNWRQANGHLKDGVCRGLLLQLERQQLVTLPPRIMDINNNSRRRTTAAPAKLDFQPLPITCSLAELAPITLHQVRRTPEEKIFNALIRQYHYLGYAQPVGEHLKYLAYAGERLVACFAFSSAPYAIDCRDSFIGWSKQARERNRHLLAYNTRFLIPALGPRSSPCFPSAWPYRPLALNRLAEPL